MSLMIRVSPHQRAPRTTAQVMRAVLYALLPGIAVQWYLFGSGVLIQLIIATVTALGCEAAFLAVRHKPIIPALKDSSALLTAWLIAVAVPPLLPWWMTVVGVFLAIVIAKQLYGGLGSNPFNPAMVAYVALLVSFPLSMTSWLPPVAQQSQPVSSLDAVSVIFTGYDTDGFSLHQLRMDADGVTQATPLDGLKTGLRQSRTTTEILGQGLGTAWGGTAVVWVNLAYLVGGVWLLGRGIIRWRIPVAMIAALALCSGVDSALHGDTAPGMMFYLMSGATMLGAFFIATDPVTASTTPRGRLIYGALIGVLVFVIRRYGGYPDAVAFAVLLSNAVVPLLDHYTQPRTFGHGGSRAA